MGKRFGELGVFIRGIFYYNLSPHEQKPFANWLSKCVPNVYPRTKATIWRWLPPFVGAYLTYRIVEYLNWASHRKNPKDYVHEKPPPPPKLCRRVVEPKPHCKKDWVYEEYECAEGEEPDKEFLKILEERRASEGNGDE